MGVPTLSNCPEELYMSRKDLLDMVWELGKQSVEGTVIEIVDVELVKESGIDVLRVLIDKPAGVSLDDCADISRKMSVLLDQADPIETPYHLEVSSPGIDRPFKSEEDYGRNKGENVEVKLYSKMLNAKQFTGVLVQYDEESITIDISGEVLTIDRKNIAKINKAVVF